MKRQNMRNQSRTGVTRGKNVFGKSGAVRCGMHQKNEFEYRRAAMMAEISEPEEETAEEALDIPETLEEMIPPETDETVKPVEIAADEQVLEEVEIAEENEEPEQAVFSVDYSGERIPVLQPQTGGVDCEPVQLIYDRGDGSVRPIPDPLGILSMEGIEPFFAEIENPSRNVPAA